MNRKLSDIARAAGLEPFAHDGSYCGSLSKHAARVTEGRTHYFDPDTLRYFGARVHDLRTFGDRTILTAVESVSPPNSPRAFRVVAFDVDGTVIYRTGDKNGERSGLCPVLKYQPGEFGHATRARALAELNALAPMLEALAERLLVKALLGLSAQHKRKAAQIDAAVFTVGA